MEAVAHRRCTLFAGGVYGCRPHLTERSHGRKVLVPARSLLSEEPWQRDPELCPWNKYSLVQP